MAARFLSENKAIIPYHYFIHSHNICLQGTAKTLVYLRDAIETAKEINNHICFSHKRFHLLSTNFVKEEASVIKTPMSNKVDIV